MSRGGLGIPFGKCPSPSTLVLADLNTQSPQLVEIDIAYIHANARSSCEWKKNKDGSPAHATSLSRGRLLQPPAASSPLIWLLFLLGTSVPAQPRVSIRLNFISQTPSCPSTNAGDLTSSRSNFYPTHLF